MKAKERAARNNLIVKLRWEGWTWDKIAEKVGISRSGIYKIRRTIKKKKLPSDADTLCWRCAKACGLCLWSKYKVQKPVPGWKAKKVILYSTWNGQKRKIVSYLVESCPEFVSDGKKH